MFRASTIRHRSGKNFDIKSGAFLYSKSTDGPLTNTQWVTKASVITAVFISLRDTVSNGLENWSVTMKR